MRLTVRHIISFPILLLAATVAGQNYVTFEGAGADRLFRQSRNAVGGEAAVVGVASLVMKGRVRVSTPDGGPPERGIEMRILLPDHYLRIEDGGAWGRRSGFSGNTLLTEIRRGTATEKPPAQITEALLRGEKARLARLLLGMASLATPEVWLTIKQPGDVTEVGSALGRVLEARNVKADFMSQVYYDTPGLPLRVEYEAGARRVALAFGDRRKVGALLLPHTMTTTLNGMPFEEITLSEIVVNPPLTAGDFQIVK